jgi:AraC-like DNA-binding protein
MLKKRHAPADEPHFLVRTLATEFPGGRALAPHAHPWGQLIYAASGVLSVWTEQGSWVAPPHWAVWAPADVAHAMRSTGTALLRTLYVRPGLAGQPAQSAVITVSPLLRELILRAVEIGMLDRREPAHVAMADLILHELRAQSTPSLDLPQPRSVLFRRVAEHVAAAPGERSGHAALAKRFGIGARTLERGFVDETGLSLGRWRRQARFLHALRRLGGGAPVKQAALEAGYRSASAFIAAFRVALNTTPGRYFDARHR